MRPRQVVKDKGRCPKSAIKKREKKMAKTILIALVVAIVVGGAAAYGGYKMGDGAGFERANLVRQQFAQQRQGGQGQSGQSGTGGSASQGAGISGVIKSVDGDTLTVTLGQREVQVKLSDQTQVEKAGAGNRDDLKAGARIMITPAGASGGSTSSIAATTILVLQSGS